MFINLENGPRIERIMMLSVSLQIPTLKFTKMRAHYFYSDQEIHILHHNATKKISIVKFRY